MAIPDFQSIMLPFLEALANGQQRSMKDMVELLAQRFNLTEDERNEMLPSGQSRVFSNRVTWAKTHLKNAWLVSNPTRGQVQILDAGAAVLAEAPGYIDVKFLRRFDTYQKFLGGQKDDDLQPLVASTPNTAASTPLELFETSFGKLKATLAEDLLTRLQNCSPQFFEHVVVRVLHAMGYGGQFGESKVTSFVRDGGIDGIIYEDKLGLDIVCVQAKRWQGDG